MFSPAYSEAMGSTGNKNRCSLCPRQLSTARFHIATQNGVSLERGDCHAPRRQRGREVNSKDGASCVKYLYGENSCSAKVSLPPHTSPSHLHTHSILPPSFLPSLPSILLHLCHDDVPNKVECPSSTLNCKNFH